MKNDIAKVRSEYSVGRLSELKGRLNGFEELKRFSGLAIFGAGSYARQEASEHSDIDMFFLSDAQSDSSELRANSLRVFGKVLQAAEEMSFPKFSNDCEYLVVLSAEDILSNLGSRTDDHENYFTARMLLLLESHCLYGVESYNRIVASIVNSYFKDYPSHQQAFQPIFLLNDIGRFWKTMLLNYEHKRGFSSSEGDVEEKKMKQRVRNFKLKYSRMTTCFASIAAFGSMTSVNEAKIIEIMSLTPRERLQAVADRHPAVKTEVDAILESYNWFLEMTGKATKDLELNFNEKSKRSKMFDRANEYGDKMFSLLQALDSSDPQLKLVRHLVI